MAKIVLIFLIICYLTIVNCQSWCYGLFEKDVKINDEVKQRIINKHNELRTLILTGSVKGWPQGTDLFVIRWDDKLAEQAQRRVEYLKCPDGKPDKPPADDRFNSVGDLELSYGSYTEGNDPPEFELVIQTWFDQHKQYKYPTFPTGFAQIVKNDTQYVGCGYVAYNLPKEPGRKGASYLCLYGPGVRFPYHDGSPTYTPLAESHKTLPLHNKPLCIQ